MAGFIQIVRTREVSVMGKDVGKGHPLPDRLRPLIDSFLSPELSSRAKRGILGLLENSDPSTLYVLKMKPLILNFSEVSKQIKSVSQTPSERLSRHRFAPSTLYTQKNLTVITGSTSRPRRTGIDTSCGWRRDKPLVCSPFPRKLKPT
jgi:hypothetical protein